MVDTVAPMGAAQLALYVPSSEDGNQLYDFIRHFEASGPLTADSKYLRAYDDGAQFSIGYGTEVGRMAKSLGLDEGQLRSGAISITPEQGEQVMQEEIDEVRADVVAKLKRYEKAAGHPYTQLNDDAIDALTSFAYNLGPGNLNQLTDNGARDIATVLAKIPEYNKARNKAGQKVTLEGLVRRRESEAALFRSSLNDNYSPNDSIGQALSSSTPQPTTLGQQVSPPVPKMRAPQLLDIDPSASLAAAVMEGRKEMASPRVSDATMSEYLAKYYRLKY